MTTAEAPKIDRPSTAETASRSLALIGHPNVGKSVIFHALTGKYVTVSNFPGTTVDLSRGIGNLAKKDWVVYDTPGVVSLQPRTDDERVTRDLIFEAHPDVVVQVADAKNLAKALHLTLEIADFGCPMVLVLNMMDEAQDRGQTIDTERLSKLLGIPVIGTVAITGEGVTELKEAVSQAALPKVSGRYDPLFLKTLQEIEADFVANTPSHRALAISLLVKDTAAWKHAVNSIQTGQLGDMEKKVQAARSRFVRAPEMLVFEAKRSVVQEIAGEVLRVDRPGSKSWLGRLGNLCMRPFPGYLIAAGALWALYEFVGVFGAGTLVGLLEENVFGGYLNPLVTKIVETVIPITFIQEAIVGPYGIVTMALTYALALILPIVTTFFLFFGFLEDSGYLPRLAVMMDRFFRIMGLNGRAVLPMVLGLGCDTMATVTTRILDTKKEKIILSLLLTLAVPCSAQLGAILGMAAGFSPRVLLIWFGVVAGTMLSVGWGAARLLPGARAPLLIEIPPLRIPKLSNIYKKVRARLKWYLKEVIPLFILATFILFLMDKVHLLQALTKTASPLVVNFLGLPEKATEAFLIGFLRRDYGAAGFFTLAKQGLLNTRQVAVSMVVITLFMPCIAHVLMTFKERGFKAATVITGFVMGFALLVGGAVNWLLLKTLFV